MARGADALVRGARVGKKTLASTSRAMAASATVPMTMESAPSNWRRSWRRCAGALGRGDAGVGAQIAATLEANWFTRPSDLAKLSADEARAMAVPMKLVDEFKRALTSVRRSGLTPEIPMTTATVAPVATAMVDEDVLLVPSASMSVDDVALFSDRIAMKMRTGVTARATRVDAGDPCCQIIASLWTSVGMS